MRPKAWVTGVVVPFCAGTGLHWSGVAAQDSGDTPHAPEHVVEIYVSEDALQALYLRPMDLGELGDTNIRFGFFFNEDRDIVGLVDVLADFQTTRFARWDIQVGPRAYAALTSVETADIFGIAVGAQVRYSLPTNGSFSVVAGGFYAPSILTFGEADNVYDVYGRVEMRFSGGTYVFAGYRVFELDMKHHRGRKLDDGIQIGVRAAFGNSRR